MHLIYYTESDNGSWYRNIRKHLYSC